mgnify:CR=1 FL=1
MGSSREQNIKDLKKFKEGKKQVGAYIQDELHARFSEKLKKDKLTKQEVLETAIYRYLDDELPMYKKVDK